MAEMQPKCRDRPPPRKGAEEAPLSQHEKCALRFVRRAQRASSEREVDLLMDLASMALDWGPRLRDPKTIWAFMKRVERTTRADWARANARRPETALPEPDSDVPAPAPAGDNPEEAAIEAERRTMVLRAFEELVSALEAEPEPDRTILQESLLEGRSHPDIAARLPECLTADAVRQRAHRARRRLRRRLRHRCPEVWEYFEEPFE